MVTPGAKPSNEPPRIFLDERQRCHEELSKKHTSPPIAAFEAALELRSEVAPLMLAELKRLLATFNASLDVPTEKESAATIKQAVEKPSPLFYGFFLAAQWIQKEAFRPFVELISWPDAMLPNLLSEEVVSEDVVSRILAQFYDGDPASLFKPLMDRTASDSVRFWQWRTLIRVAMSSAPMPPGSYSTAPWTTSTKNGPTPAFIPNVRLKAIRSSSIGVWRPNSNGPSKAAD